MRSACDTARQAEGTDGTSRTIAIPGRLATHHASSQLDKLCVTEEVVVVRGGVEPPTFPLFRRTAPSFETDIRILPISGCRAAAEPSVAGAP